MKTTKVSVAGKSNLTVNFDEELWIPVWYLVLHCIMCIYTTINLLFVRNLLFVFIPFHYTSLALFDLLQ